jgi:hypothetical protein
VLALASGALPVEGSLELTLSRPADPALAGLLLHWQALTFPNGVGPRKTNKVTTLLQ